MTTYIGIMDGDGDAWGVRIPDLPGCFGGGPNAGLSAKFVSKSETSNQSQMP